MLNNRSYILHKLRHKKEKRDDYDIYKKNHLILKNVLNVFDLGYLGVETGFLEQLLSIPNRKKKNLELSQEEKEYNMNSSFFGSEIQIKDMMI